MEAAPKTEEIQGGDKKPKGGPREGGDKPKGDRPQGDKPKGDRKPREEGSPKKEGEEGQKGERREGAPKRDNKVKYVVKGEEGKEGEEISPEHHHEEDTGGHRPKRERKERQPREKITLETVIPELPKKEKRLKEPNDGEFEERMEKMEAKIADCYNKKHNYVTEMRDQYKDNKHKKEGTALRDVLIAKQEERKKINIEFREVNEEHINLKTEYDELIRQNDKLREKLKRFFKKDEIQAEITHLKDVLYNEKIGLQEEKKLVREIDSLEKSLPFAEPYEKHQKLLDECKARKDVVGKRKKGLWERLQVANKEVDDIKAELDKTHQSKEEREKELGPAIGSKVDEYNEEIKKLKEQKRKMLKDHEDAWHKYEEQQALVRQVEWMQRVKQRLVRDEERKKRDEQWAKEEEEAKKKEEEENKQTGHPYRVEIELCERLIKYCTNLKPKVAPVEEKKEVDTNVQRHKSKREQDNDFVIPKQKAKPKQPTEHIEKKEVVVKTNINHHIEIINSFDDVKVVPPYKTEELEKAIKQLEEKKKFFAEQTDKPAEAKPEEGAKKDESPKKEKKHHSSAAQPNLEDENEFPAF